MNTDMRTGEQVDGNEDGFDASRGTQPTELSVVIPCLNEADTLGRCIDAAHAALALAGIDGEVVVADNGSTDRSREIATSHGARLVPVAERGYGSALLGGIAAARGRWVLMGDADDSYDFGELPRFVAALRTGADLVQGCRLPSGGGTVQRGAMPPLHRWWGNPMFSWLARTWFRAPIHDVHCGMRAFRRDLVAELDLHCTGMEFASEMIIKAALRGVRLAEVPITLRPDGRVGRAPHLRTFRDGWRHLRFYLLYSPRWLFLLPGSLLILAGLAAYALALPGLRIGDTEFDVHTLLFGSVSIVGGYQAMLFAVHAKIFGVTSGLLPMDARVERAFQRVNLERGLLLGASVLLAGLVLLGAALFQWWRVDFGHLDYRATMRVAIPGATLTLIGFQTVLSSFFFSLLGLARR
jgi:glycosyltransferase involved in cell wall biosynthesis